MLEILQAGGWLMLPIMGGSIIALAIVLERGWNLRARRVLPPGLTVKVWRWHQEGYLTPERLLQLREGSPLGRVLAAGLANRRHAREVMKEAISDEGRQVVADLERYLNTLGTIAAISPLLGLLGTVSGMIKAFTALSSTGASNPTLLAGGIAEALIATAAGLAVAIPALIFHRYFDGRVERFALEMEAQAFKMVEILQGQREGESG